MAFFKTKFSSGNSDWETPIALFDSFDAEFHFTLDVCASAGNAKCDQYFDKAKNGLIQDWSGVCWMNPPYGRGMVDWLKKAVAEGERGVTTAALIPARTNTGWWHDICQRFGEVRFLRGRPVFLGAKHGLPQPLALVIFGPKGKYGNGRLGGRPKGKVESLLKRALLRSLIFHRDAEAKGRYQANREHFKKVRKAYVKKNRKPERASTEMEDTSQREKV